ncbi:hypothetical protein H6F86_11980 [Phormidium sp. FACHB-592]|uniref:Uncharacterized protein n=1 Tax=Stenomitos frigidus AS-A4 TaxID=2933935 RepID=A0ABV0KKB2_9CYAN|nr:hypothetical protein [Phormidium sp. FACHB-592]MBD2074592.1 hypothetical protein [Phormidium sp. FACHB-592]
MLVFSQVVYEQVVYESAHVQLTSERLTAAPTLVANKAFPTRAIALTIK